MMLKKNPLKNSTFKSYVPLFFLLLFAFCYYGFYYRSGLYPAGEGGVEGVTALRLLSGKVPLVDITLNYNLLWFYPIAGLFKIFGPSYTVLRIFFFALATMTGLLAFYVIQITTRSRNIGLVAALLVLILPGQLFRNYMAFCVLLNMATFLKGFVLPCRSLRLRLLWMGLASLSLGLTFLIRIDLGFFFSILFVGLSLLSPWISSIEKKTKAPRWLLSLSALCLGMVGFLTLHLPIYHDAVQRGFSVPFVAQYQQWPVMIAREGSRLLKEAAKKTPSLFPREHVGPVTQKASPPLVLLAKAHPEPLAASPQKSTLVRRSLSSSDIREQIMALNLYLPIPCALLLGLLALTFLCSRKRESSLPMHGWILISSLGCSLTLFPQYFFWRPDMVHLSEFMVPMTVTLLIAATFIVKLWPRVGSYLRTLMALCLLLILADLSLYYINGCQSQSTGGIAISQGRTCEFQGANGVHVKLTPLEFEEATAISQSILKHSNPGEYVLCYPYNPEINFMTDRPSYRHDLYSDDMTAPKDFDQNTITEIERYQPAAIVVTDWPINGTEHSRFSNWAATTYAYLQSHYQEDYQHGIIHVFVRQKN